MARLMAAMSGGVDSSVAAALALDAGHDVVGVTLKQWEFPDEEPRLSKGCCTLDAVADARRACEIFGIAHYTFDFREIFARDVVDPWVSDYARGATPNPCVRCNELVRFGALVDKAEMLGFDGLVTGHWARSERKSDGRMRLYRARNRAKDQSYVLYAISQRALDRARFPLGEVPSKSDVRERARELRLPNWDRADSVDVCFVGEDRRPGDVVAERKPDAVRSGVIVDRDGNVVGEHGGLAYYTVGQRRGLGVIASQPRYVTALLPERNAVVVGERQALDATGLSATRSRFVSGDVPSDGERFSVAVRYRGDEEMGLFERASGPDDTFVLRFDEPVRAVAPGQAAVLYDGDEVVGGGTIVRAL